MPRRGYRFVAPVVALQNEADRGALETPANPKRRTPVTAGWAAGVAIALVMFGLAVSRLWMTEDVRRPVAEFSVSEPDGHRFSASAACWLCHQMANI
jgi:hypothetical protein